MTRHYPNLDSASVWPKILFIQERIIYCLHQSESPSKYGWCHVISMVFLRTYIHILYLNTIRFKAQSLWGRVK